VTLACLLASAAALYILVATAKMEATEALHLLGWWPIQPLDVLRSLLLTVLLFLGPLFELIFVTGALSDLRSGRKLIETLSSWQGYRNFVAGPITEEILFRSVLVPLHLLAKVAPPKVVLFTPLYFGIAHVHHFYEFTLTHPHTPLAGALLRSVFQFGFTTVFGWLATFVYIRTGSLYSCIFIHILCNWIGLPRFWGKLRRQEEHPMGPTVMRGKEDSDTEQPKEQERALGLQWTMAYYALLFAGSYLFYAQLWTLTESTQALARFASEAKEAKPKRWF
jgi:prenyl protein peptidase